MVERFKYQESRGIKQDNAEEFEFLPMLNHPSYHNSKEKVGQNQATEGQRAPLLAWAEV